MHYSTIFILLITFFLLISATFVFYLRKEVSSLKEQLVLKNQEHEELKRSKDNLKLLNSKYENLKTEISEVLDFVARGNKAKFYSSILSHEQSKRAGGSVIGGIVLKKIRFIHTPIPPNPDRSNERYTDRQQLKERDPTH